MLVEVVRAARGETARGDGGGPYSRPPAIASGSKCIHDGLCAWFSDETRRHVCVECPADDDAHLLAVTPRVAVGAEAGERPQSFTRRSAGILNRLSLENKSGLKSCVSVSG
jgi:hypothetical protein